MEQTLIVRLRRPKDGWVQVEVDSDNFEVRANGHDDADVQRLNDELKNIRYAIPDADLFASFPRFVRRLRQRDAEAQHISVVDVSDRDLALFFRVAFPRGTPASSIISAANMLLDPDLTPIVEFVRIRGGFRSTSVGNQGYVNPAVPHGGLNVRPVWNLSYVDPDDQTVKMVGTGKGITVCVVDGGYQADHDYLPQERIEYVELPPGNPSIPHGTRVLGVLAAIPSEDITGIVHGAKFLVASTLSDPGPNPREFEGAPPLEAKRVVWAMDRAMEIEDLKKGGVFLVQYEVQQSENVPALPIESHEDIAKFFREVVSRPTTVVEPAGNGKKNIDSDVIQQDQPGDESQAIMVGAGMSPLETTPRSRHSESNFGVRVDCQAWGDHVFTLKAYSSSYSQEKYFPDFRDTSAASSIIAGLVAQIQSIYFEAKEDYLSPLDIREKLSDPNLGLAQVARPEATDPEPIGPQPDLVKVLRDLDVLPDVFLRDHVDDRGEEPSPRPDIWYSPDIITRVFSSEDPDTDFSDWEDPDLATEITRGERNYVYLRADNRGPFDDTPTFEVYWAYPSTFLDPKNWRHVGSTTARVPGLKSQNTRKVLGPVPWDTPINTTSPCLIVVAHSAFDPEPEITPSNTPREYVDQIRLYNNIAHRNVAVAAPIDNVALWRFNINVPRIAGQLPTRIRVTPRGIATQSRLFLGVPEDEQEALFAGTRNLRLQAVDLDSAPDPVRAWIAARVGDVSRPRIRPAGDQRRLDGQSLKWFISDDAGFHLSRVATRPGHEVPLILGVYVPDLNRRTDLEIDVSQDLASFRVGQVNLRT